MAVTIFISLMNIISVARNEPNITETRYNYISNFNGSINHGILNTTVKTNVTGKSSVTKVKIKMELQKLSDGSYSTIETWEQTFYNNYGAMEESKLTNPLSTYRLKSTVTAYSGSNSESETFYEY